LAGDVELDLPALVAVEADVVRALALAIEAADVEAPAAAQRAAIVEVDALLVIVEDAGDLDRAAGHIAGLGDEVDEPARRIGREGRGRATADRLNGGKVEVVAQEHVGGDVEDVAELDNRQAVLLQLDVFGTAGRERQAADGVVGVALARCRLDAQARQGAQDVGQRTRPQLLDLGAA